MRMNSVLLAIGLQLLLGCGKSNPEELDSRSPLPLEKSEAPAAQPQEPKGGAAPPAELLPRKIVRTASVELVVEDFDESEQRLKQLLTRHKDAYLAQAEVTGSAGSPRRGLWRIRVPVAEFDNFVAALVQLGVPRKNTIDAKDVSEEYYDLDARIKNQKVEEARLLAHLEKSTGKLEDILAVEREISRVRGEIERQEGRLRLLANLTALTTVTVTMQEVKNYIPPQAPSFSRSISETFSNSVDLLVTAGSTGVLIAVAIAPWLPVLGLLVLPIVLYRRRSVVRASPLSRH